MSLFSELEQERPSVMVSDASQGHWQRQMQALNQNVRGLLELLFEQLDGHEDLPGKESLAVDKALKVLTTGCSGQPALLPTVIPHQEVRLQLLESLGARCLAKIRELGGEVAAKQLARTDRLARAWWWLRDHCCRLTTKQIRWVRPLVEAERQTPLEEAKSLLCEIDQLSGRETRICFPTIPDCQVMVLRLTALKPPGKDGLAVQVAPWSVYGIDANTHKILNKLATALPHLQTEGRRASVPVLIELYPAGEDYKRRDEPLFQPPQTLEVVGESLSLAFCLAAWAVNHTKYLRRICATGKVLEGGRIGMITMDDGKDKLQPVVDLFFRVERRVIFFIPKGNEPDRYAAEKLLPNVVINGLRKHQQVRPLEHLDNLCSGNSPPILTDCFDEYRVQVREWDVKDQQGYDQGTSLFAAQNRTNLVLVDEFDNDPLATAATVTRALIDCIENENVKRPDSAAENPIPLLFPLEEFPATGNDTVAEVATVLKVGIDHWRQKHGLCFEVDTTFENLLKQVSGEEQRKLWLIVYCGKSLAMKPYADLEKRIARLEEYLEGRTAHLVFVASDYHHYLMLSKHLKLDQPPASTLRT